MRWKGQSNERDLKVIDNFLSHFTKKDVILKKNSFVKQDSHIQREKPIKNLIILRLLGEFSIGICTEDASPTSSSKESLMKEKKSLFLFLYCIMIVWILKPGEEFRNFLLFNFTFFPISEAKKDASSYRHRQNITNENKISFWTWKRTERIEKECDTFLKCVQTTNEM